MQIDIKTLFDSIERQPVDSLTAYRDCLFVMANCAPLRFHELLSITPDTAEAWHTMPDGTKRYGWRFKSSRTMNTIENVIVLIPDKLVTLAQRAIRRLQELQPGMTSRDLKSLTINRELRNDCFKLRRFYAEAQFRNFGRIESGSSGSNE